LRKSANAKKLNQVVNEAVIDTNKRRGLPSDGLNNLNVVTMKSFRKRLGIRKVKGQKKTDARQIAEADLRSVVTMAAIRAAYTKDLLAELIFNWDATQYYGT
jgi:hypothetical protein